MTDNKKQLSYKFKNEEFIKDFTELSKKDLEMKYNKKYDSLRKYGNKLGLSRKKFLTGRPPTLKNVDFLYDEYKNDMSITKLSKKYKLSRFVITQSFKRNNFTLRGENDKGWKRKYNFNEKFFEKIDTPAKAYILGFIFADGCLYSGKKGNNLMRININKKDVEILEFIKTMTESESPIKSLENGSIDIKLFSKKMYADLLSLGCTERKSLTLQFPTISTELLSDFIRGYFDGDGTVTFCIKKGKIKCPHWTIYSSFDFCNELNKIMHEIYKFPLKTVTKTNNIAKISYTSKNDFNKIYKLFYNNEVFSLNRKKSKLEYILKNY